MEQAINIYNDAVRARDGSVAEPLGQPDSEPSLKIAPVLAPHETRITIILPTNAYFMSGVRDFTMHIVQNMTGFPQKWAFRFQSIVDELSNNAIEHGSTAGKEVKVTFVSKEGESIEVIVDDTGTGPRAVTAEEMYTILRERQAMLASRSYSGIRGRGLAQIVSQWTDVLKFDNIPGGGLRVSALKHLDISEKTKTGPENTIHIT